MQTFHLEGALLVPEKNVCSKWQFGPVGSPTARMVYRSILHTKSSLMVWQLAWNPQIYERDCIILHQHSIHWQSYGKCWLFPSPTGMTVAENFEFHIHIFKKITCKKLKQSISGYKYCLLEETYLPKKTFPLNCPRYPPPWIHFALPLSGWFPWPRAVPCEQDQVDFSALAQRHRTIQAIKPVGKKILENPKAKWLDFPGVSFFFGGICNPRQLTISLNMRHFKEKWMFWCPSSSSEELPVPRSRANDTSVPRCSSHGPWP